MVRAMLVAVGLLMILGFSVAPTAEAQPNPFCPWDDPEHYDRICFGVLYVCGMNNGEETCIRP